MRILVLAVTPRPGRPSPLVPGLVARLSERHCAVSVVDPDIVPLDLSTPSMPRWDLVVLKSGTEAALSWAGALAASGVPVVNPYPVAAVCRDKVVQTTLLHRAGVPVPRSWTTTDPSDLVPQLASGPLIVKPPRGSQGRGIHVATTPAGLAGLRPGTPWLVMRYHRPVGPDLKLYRIGDEVFGVERPFPARTYSEKLGRAVPVDDELRDLVERCGSAFGIEVYGVDVVRSGDRRWVVDMSAFPGFKGVPQAGARIADHLLAGGAAAASTDVTGWPSECTG